MQSFKDNKDQTWNLEVTVGVIKKVRSALDIDLARFDEQLFVRLESDPVLLADVLWLVCEKEAGERNVSDEEFGRALSGDPIEHATDALLGAIADFFPGRKRSLLRKMIEKTATLQTAAGELAMAKIDDPKLMEKLKAAMEARMTTDIDAALDRLNSPTSLAASLASTPATSR